MTDSEETPLEIPNRKAYSRRMIILFSLLFSPVMAGLMVAANIEKTSNSRRKWISVFYAFFTFPVLYAFWLTGVVAVILLRLGYNYPLALDANIIFVGIVVIYFLTMWLIFREYNKWEKLTKSEIGLSQKSYPIVQSVGLIILSVYVIIVMSVFSFSMGSQVAFQIAASRYPERTFTNQEISINIPTFWIERTEYTSWCDREFSSCVVQIEDSLSDSWLTIARLTGEYLESTPESLDEGLWEVIDYDKKTVVKLTSYLQKGMPTVERVYSYDLNEEIVYGIHLFIRTPDAIFAIQSSAHIRHKDDIEEAIRSFQILDDGG